MCSVIRDGDNFEINTEDLLVGDVYILKAGMQIPADSILIQGQDVQVDESCMTGEPDELPKFAVTEENYEHNPSPFLMAKTMMTKGEGKGIVCCVGQNTFAGKVEEKLHIEDEATPLQQKLEVIANEIGKIGVYVALFTFIIMTLRMVYVVMNDENKNLFNVENLDNIVKYIIIGITIIVVAVPEGLPLAVTMSLAFSVMKMKEE